MAPRDTVSKFLSGFLDGEPEDWLVEYVAEFLMDADLVAGSMADLADIISTSCPTFDQLLVPEKHARLSDLHGQVHQQPDSSSDRTALAPAPPAATPPTPQRPTRTPAVVDSSSAASEPGSPSASGSGGQTPAGGDGMVNSLRDLCAADVSQEFLAHVLQHHGQGSVQRAAEWVLECEDISQQQAAWLAAAEKRRQQEIKDAAAEKLARKALLARFMLQECKPLPDPSKPRPVQAWPSNQPCRPSTVRYRDGMVASTKGEKYVVQKVGEEWDGGSKGKVYTKGKRGKGVV